MLLDGERCVCELMAGLDMPQSTVSRHLAYLKNSGWVTGERRGVWSYYRLREPTTDLHRGLLELLAAHLPKDLAVAGLDLAAMTAAGKANRC